MLIHVAAFTFFNSLIDTFHPILSSDAAGTRSILEAAVVDEIAFRRTSHPLRNYWQLHSTVRGRAEAAYWPPAATMYASYVADERKSLSCDRDRILPL